MRQQPIQKGIALLLSGTLACSLLSITPALEAVAFASNRGQDPHPTFVEQSAPAGLKTETAEQLATHSLQLLLATSSPELSAPNENLNFAVQLQNTGKLISKPGTISVYLDTSPESSAATFEAGFEATAPLLFEAAVETLEPGVSQDFSASLSTAELAKLLPADAVMQPGTYRLQAVYTPGPSHFDRGDGTVTLDYQLPEPITTELPAANNTAPYNASGAGADGTARAHGQAAEEAFAAITTFRLEAAIVADSANGDTADTGDTAGAGDATDAAAEQNTTISDTADAGTATTAATEPGAVSVIVPLVLPEKITTLPNQTELAEIFAQGAPLPRLLELGETAQATFAIDPRIIIAIRAAGEAAPSGATEFLQRLENSAAQKLLLNYADADFTGQALAGIETPLQISQVSFATAAGIFPENTVPDLTELASLQTAAGNLAWFQPAGATPAALKLAAQAGSANYLIADSDAPIANTNASAQDTPTAQLPDGKTAVIYSNALATAASRIANNASDSLLAQAAHSTLTAQLAQPGKHVLVLDRGSASNNQRTAQLLESLINSGTGFAPLADFIAVPAPATSVNAPNWPHTDFAARELKAAVKREKSVITDAPALVQPEQLGDYQRSRLLHLFRGGNFSNDLTRSNHFGEVVTAYRETDTSLLEGIRLLSPAQTQIFGREAQLPLQIRNTLPFSVEVSLELESASAAITVGRSQFQNLQLAPGETITVLAPVRSRISSGEAQLVVHLENNSGDHTISTDTFNLSLASRVETIAVALLATTATLLLGFGIWRSYRKGKLKLEYNQNQ